MTLTQIDHVEGTTEERIDNCFEASQACEWCADECPQMGDAEMARCIQRCRDTGDLTTSHARFMARDSEYSDELAASCATACDECATECEQFDAAHCQVCAETLRACAETCREMASA